MYKHLFGEQLISFIFATTTSSFLFIFTSFLVFNLNGLPSHLSFELVLIDFLCNSRKEFLNLSNKYVDSFTLFCTG